MEEISTVQCNTCDLVIEFTGNAPTEIRCPECLDWIELDDEKEG
jgi:phage FluMu protein Com